MVAFRSRLRAGACVLAVAVIAAGTAGCATTAPAQPSPAASAPTASASSLSTPSAPTASASPVSAPSAPAPSTVTVVTIGDSIMAGFGLDPDEAWPELLAARTQQPVVNLACSGAGFVQEGDCGVAFSGLIADAVAARPDIIILQSSDNDVDEDRGDIDEETQETVDRLHDALPDARIVGVGTLWNQPWDPPESIQWSSEALRASVDDVGGTFVSIGQPFQDKQELLQWDGEHPTAAGQRMLAARILRALDRSGVEL